MQHDISQDAETVHQDTKMDKPKSKYTSIHEKPKEANTLVYICYNKNSAQKGEHTPSSPRKRMKVTWSSGFVKMSASWFWVDT